MNNFTTLRVGQLPSEVWSGTDNLPHEVGTELKRGTVANLATYIASVIDASEGLAFNSLKITDGQTLPTTTSSEWILTGKGTYLQGGGFPDVVCTDDINVVTSDGNSWTFSFGIVIEIPESVSEKFPLTSPNSTVTVGGALANTVLADRTAIDVLTEILIVYLSPQFTAKACNYPSLVEVGTMVSGIYTFTWAISNPTNIVPNSVNIFDVNADDYLVTGLDNDGSEAVALNGNTLNTNNATQVWQISAENTKSEVVESGNIVTTAKFRRFFGSTSATPTTGTARSLGSEFQSANAQTFTLNTGSTLTKFAVCLPSGVTISSVIDLDALNLNITSNYTSLGTININDIGGTPRVYNLYEMNIGAPYSANHRHQITTV